MIRALAIRTVQSVRGGVGIELCSPPCPVRLATHQKGGFDGEAFRKAFMVPNDIRVIALVHYRTLR